MGTMRSATSDAGSVSKKRKKVMASEDTVRLLDMYCRLKYAAVNTCHFKISGLSVKDHCKNRKGNL